MGNWLAVMLFALCSVGLLADKPLPLLDEKTTFSNQGSRSEARHYYLLLDGQAIPDTYWFVHQEGRSYRFQQRQHLWGEDGYVPVKEEFKATPSDKAIQAEETKQKWYQGPARLQGTPEHWVYLEWMGGSAYADPIAIQKLAEWLKLPRIPRDLTIEQLDLMN